MLPAGAPPAGSPEIPPAARPIRTGDVQRQAGELYSAAQALIKRGRDDEARARLAEIGERYSDTRWFVSAMMVKIDLEDRRGLRERDPATGQMAPASVATKRLLVERAPTHSVSEAALWQLGEYCAGAQQYAAAVQAYEDLATRFPNTRLDAWFKVGELSEARLKKRAEARAAYLKVPRTSGRYAEAQARAGRLPTR